MSQTSKETILEELRNLIDDTCETAKMKVTYEKMHKAIVKKFFNAESVTFDSKNDLVSLDLNYGNDVQNRSTAVINVNFETLSVFLKACLNEDDNSLKFYIDLLHYYHSDTKIPPNKK